MRFMILFDATTTPLGTVANIHCSVSSSGQNLGVKLGVRSVSFCQKKTILLAKRLNMESGVVQVKALPELWISFSLLSAPGFARAAKILFLL